MSPTRGGYYALKALVTKARQAKTACYVSYWPRWQHPGAPEAMQVYQFDFRPPEVRTLADDIATTDSLQRAARFMQAHLGAN